MFLWNFANTAHIHTVWFPQIRPTIINCLNSLKLSTYRDWQLALIAAVMALVSLRYSAQHYILFCVETAVVYALMSVLTARRFWAHLWYVFGWLRFSTGKRFWLWHRYLFLNLYTTPRLREIVNVLIGKVDIVGIVTHSAVWLFLTNNWSTLEFFIFNIGNLRKRDNQWLLVGEFRIWN